MKNLLLPVLLILLSVSTLQAQEVLYSQDFEDYDSNPDWELVQGDAVFAVGMVSNINNTSKMMSSSEIKQSIMTLNNKKFTGPFNIEVEAYPSFNFSGIIVNYVDNDNFVVVTVDNNDKRVRVRQVVNGVWDSQFPVGDGDEWRLWIDGSYVSEPLVPEIMAWSEGKPDLIHWKIMVDPDLGTITVYIDGNLILEDVSVALPQYEANVGIYTWWCRHAFDNIKVTVPEIDTKVSNLKADSKLSIYPNPVTAGMLKLDASKMTGLVKVEIIDISGVVKYTTMEKSRSTIQINLSEIAKGLYFLKATDASGVSNVEKIIIH
jgi:hypothetical protein